MARTGRPRIYINQEEFEHLCQFQCTEVEICDWYGCTEDTLNSWCKRTYKMTFSEVFAQKRGTGRASLRRSQWQLAETNPTMAIWLGKQYLGQSDNGAVSEAALDKATELLGDVESAID